MSNLVIIFVSLILGVLLRRLKTVPENAHISINQVILNVALPALVLRSLPGVQWDPKLFTLCLVPWSIFFVGWMIFEKSSWPQEVKGALILTAGLGNTSFIGFPVIEALYGQEGLRYAILLDQPGTFMIVSTVGLVVATKYSAGNLKRSEFFMKIITFPPFVSFLVAFVLAALGWKSEGMVDNVLERLGSMLTPLALISVGLQWKLGDVKTEGKYLLAGLSYKLIIAPLLIFGVLKALGVDGIFFNVAVLEAGMASMVTASILAQLHGLRPRLAGLMLGIGVPASFITLLLWKSIL